MLIDATGTINRVLPSQTRPMIRVDVGDHIRAYLLNRPWACHLLPGELVRVCGRAAHHHKNADPHRAPILILNARLWIERDASAATLWRLDSATIDELDTQAQRAEVLLSYPINTRTRTQITCGATGDARAAVVHAAQRNLHAIAISGTISATPDNFLTYTITSCAPEAQP
jgi:hypothetical protein